MVVCTCVRGSTLAQFDTVLLLLFEGRTPCSTSYSSSRKISALRVINLRKGRIPPLYESLFEKEEYSHSTSHELLLFRATGVSSTSHSSRRKGTSTLRVITLQARRSLLYGLLLFELYLAINNSSTSHSLRRKNTSTLRVVTLREGRILPLYESLLFELYLAINNSSTSHS